MRLLALMPLCLLLPGCHLLAPPTVENLSTYVCPDGREVTAGISADRRHMRLTLDGQTRTLDRDNGSNSYSNGYYNARTDDLFLHLSLPGTLLPLHCQLLTSTGP
ncbi:MAG TPA: hypothetical protein VFM34_00365 [Moraxellaceae bacterium]|nr:hypothetical protein [Moraxellaceae bacterium]